MVIRKLFNHNSPVVRNSSFNQMLNLAGGEVTNIRLFEALQLTFIAEIRSQEKSKVL